MTMTRVKMARFDFITKVRLKIARYDWGPLRDTLELCLKLAWVVFLFGLFVFAPPTIGRIYGPGWGVLVALLGFPIWATLGIGPRPGCFSFLEWMIYMTGYMVILGSVLGRTLDLLKPLLRH